jgi:hypothetical protein
LLLQTLNISNYFLLAFADIIRLLDTVLAPLLSNMIRTKVCSTIEKEVKDILESSHTSLDQVLIKEGNEVTKAKMLAEAVPFPWEINST